MNSVRRVCLLVTVALLFPASARVAAEIAYGESIEWIALDSDAIVAGKIAGVEKAVGQDKKDYEVATIDVSKTFKGKQREKVTFVVPNYLSGVAAHWKATDASMLLFLRSFDRHEDKSTLPKGHDWVLRDDGNFASAVRLGKTDRPRMGTGGVLARDFEVLKDPAAIEKRVEDVVRSAPKDGTPRRHTLEVPYGTAVYKALSDMSAVMLDVPIDGSLEKLGRRWCKSPGSTEREEGAKILGYFKNDANIEILKSLLGDPSESTETNWRSVPGKSVLEIVNRKRIYAVRKQACGSLRQLGEKFQQPVVEVLLEGKEEAPARTP